MRESTLRLLEEMQVNEKTDSEIYTRLARRVGGENGEVLRRMAADEARHCEVWSRYTKKPAAAKYASRSEPRISYPKGLPLSPSARIKAPTQNIVSAL